MLYIGFFIVVLAAFIVAHVLNLRRVRSLRSKGHYPLPGQESVAAARKLLDMGERNMAVRCYRAATRCSLKDASMAVAMMQVQAERSAR